MQTAGVLDDTYAAAAEALSYGAQLTDSGVTFRVWAPTAQQVELVIYSADKKVIASHPMTATAPPAPGPGRGEAT